MYLLPGSREDLGKTQFSRVTASRLAKLANFETADMIVFTLHSYLREIGEVKEVSFEGLQFEYKRQLMTCYLLLLIILPYTVLYSHFTVFRARWQAFSSFLDNKIFIELHFCWQKCFLSIPSFFQLHSRSLPTASTSFPVDSPTAALRSPTFTLPITGTLTLVVSHNTLATEIRKCPATLLHLWEMAPRQTPIRQL